jgi:hypothetical protein
MKKGLVRCLDKISDDEDDAHLKAMIYPGGLLAILSKSVRSRLGWDLLSLQSHPNVTKNNPIVRWT